MRLQVIHHSCCICDGISTYEGKRKEEYMLMYIHVADVKREHTQNTGVTPARPCTRVTRLFLLRVHDETMGSLQQAVGR